MNFMESLYYSAIVNFQHTPHWLIELQDLEANATSPQPQPSITVTDDVSPDNSFLRTLAILHMGFFLMMLTFSGYLLFVALLIALFDWTNTYLRFIQELIMVLTVLGFWMALLRSIFFTISPHTFLEYDISWQEIIHFAQNAASHMARKIFHAFCIGMTVCLAIQVAAYFW